MGNIVTRDILGDTKEIEAFLKEDFRIELLSQKVSRRNLKDDLIDRIGLLEDCLKALVSPSSEAEYLKAKEIVESAFARRSQRLKWEREILGIGKE